MLWIITGILISYFLGSIPTAYIFGRILKGIDIRQFGSGNVGATNALRVLGKGPGALVLAIDILKGFVSAALLAGALERKAHIAPEILCVLLGLSCICGHNWTIFLRFKGGKGIATTLGVLIGLTTKIASLKSILLALIIIWVIVFLFSRIVSLASLIAGISFPFFIYGTHQSYFLFIASLTLSLFVVIRHKANIARLLKGQEHRISFKKS